MFMSDENLPSASEFIKIIPVIRCQSCQMKLILRRICFQDGAKCSTRLPPSTGLQTVSSTCSD